MNLRITVWDLNSGTLATQLTMIDRDLFVRIPATEIEVVIHQKSSRNAPNLGAWIAFSHRIACLTASEILAIKQLDMRTRIMARFINTAEKCFELGNFQSCRSILAGLQSPPIYRLRRSWAYLRTHHATRYEAMEKLCKIYKNPRCPKYQKAWAAVKCDPPCMPYVGHFLIQVLGLSDLWNVRSNCICNLRRDSFANITEISDSALVRGNFDDLCSEDKSKSIEPKQSSVAGRIVAAALARLKFTTRRNVVPDNKSDAWTCRQRYLARKFFRRWDVIVLRSRMRAENDERLKNVDSRRKHVLDVATWLTECQRCAQNYRFPLNSFACEFLLKARYREDRENFFISLKLEPPKTR
ncbi:ras-specific guanine nucleotide-releasing factor RalGPS1-like [Pseudomyrmex gracilis]|uniref:ras-specific guanine nucleotide-releasing factor RalGPS1-like n=1 Tax=Pseudomyrmex gracilis TaxID=219809 RepID=UPI000995B9A9|nr:ras-specific guanine nucleotide-releasing factor RalGPS1-like [Pseudomyrmex gracilis]XP_020292703.1 ras-specific guanine nucleotide-releasing factor RalGPS1-like [Pseudomyrmex gracilis]XP_020292704.1 ras-specific guanine nucleotide-releasing factor RalGPS1-like [Pseudomyrmex gracilis]